MSVLGRRGRARRGHAAGVGILVVLALALAACGGQTTPAAELPTAAPLNATFEEAALVALGHMFRTYGAQADPVPVEVTGEIETHNGQRVWRVDGTYEVTVDDARRADQWTLWIGSTTEEPLTVLSTDGPQ